jgi:hypothetical protein
MAAQVKRLLARLESASRPGRIGGGATPNVAPARWTVARDLRACARGTCNPDRQLVSPVTLTHRASSGARRQALEARCPRSGAHDVSARRSGRGSTAPWGAGAPRSGAPRRCRAAQSARRRMPPRRTRSTAVSPGSVGAAPRVLHVLVDDRARRRTGRHMRPPRRASLLRVAEEGEGRRIRSAAPAGSSTAMTESAWARASPAAGELEVRRLHEVIPVRRSLPQLAASYPRAQRVLGGDTAGGTRSSQIARPAGGIHTDQVSASPPSVGRRARACGGRPPCRPQQQVRRRLEDVVPC